MSAPLTVKDLKAAIADLPDDMEVKVPDYQAGGSENLTEVEVMTAYGKTYLDLR